MFNKTQTMFCILWIMIGLVLDLAAFTIDTLKVISLAHIVSFIMMWVIMGSKV